jgi:hypothetical protein
VSWYPAKHRLQHPSSKRSSGNWYFPIDGVFSSSEDLLLLLGMQTTTVVMAAMTLFFQ